MKTAGWMFIRTAYTAAPPRVFGRAMSRGLGGTGANDTGPGAPITPRRGASGTNRGSRSRRTGPPPPRGAVPSGGSDVQAGLLQRALEPRRRAEQQERQEPGEEDG